MKTDKLLHLIQQKRVMRSGGALPLPKAQQGMVDYYFNTPKKPVKKETQTGGCPTGWIKDPVTKKCIRDTSNMPKVNPEADRNPENLDTYLYVTNQLTPAERLQYDIVYKLMRQHSADPASPKSLFLDSMKEGVRQTGGQGGVYFDTTNQGNSFYEPLTKTIHLSDADKHIPGVVPHEMFHYWQDINGDSGYSEFYPGPLKEPTIPSGNDAAMQYWNRRALDQKYITDEFLSNNPSFNFASPEVVYNRYVNPAMYDTPWTLEGEARNFEKQFQGPSPYAQDYGYRQGGSLRRAQSGNKGECPEGQVWNEEFQTCMMKGVEVNYYDQLVEQGRDFMRDWTNSPMAQQMLQRSVQKDNPTGWEQFFTNHRPLSFDTDTYSFYSTDPFWQQIRDKRLENINNIDVKFSRKEIDEKYPEDKGVSGFSRTELDKYPSSYWNFARNINPKLKQKYWKHDLRDWYDTSGNYLDSYGTSDNMEVIGYEGSNAYNALGYYPTDDSKIRNSPISRITNTPFSKDNLLDTDVHEISHASDFGGPLIPISDINLMGKYAYNTARKRQKPNMFGHYPKMVGMDEFNYYVASPTETRARLNALRFEMKNQGIYNPFTEKATIDMFGSYKPLTDSSYDALEQLRGVYTDDQIIDMLNTISRNEPDQNQMLDNIQYAKQGGSLPKHQLTGSVSAQLINQALGQTNPANVRSTVTVAPKNVAAQSVAKDIATYGSIEKAEQAKAFKKSQAAQKESKIYTNKPGYGNYEYYNPAQGEFRDDTKLAPEGSTRATFQNVLNTTNEAIENAYGNPFVNPAGKWVYDMFVGAPAQSAINLSNTFMGDRPIRGDKDFANFGWDAADVLPFVGTGLKGTKRFVNAFDNAGRMAFGVNPQMGIFPKSFSELFKKSTPISQDVLSAYNLAKSYQKEGLIKYLPESPEGFESWLQTQYNQRPLYRVVDVSPEIINDPLFRKRMASLGKNPDNPYDVAEIMGTSTAPENVINRGRRSGGHDQLLQGSNKDILYFAEDPTWIGERYGGNNPYYVKVFADPMPIGLNNQVNQLRNTSRLRKNYSRYFPDFDINQIPSGVLFEDKTLRVGPNLITPIIGTKGAKVRDAAAILSDMEFKMLQNKFFGEGGSLDKYQWKYGQVSPRDSVQNMGYNSMTWEDNRGSASGYGLSNFGNPALPVGASKDDAVNWYMDKYYPQLGAFPTAMEKASAGDFMYNAGRDPRVYMLDQYLKSIGQSGLPNRGSYNVDIKTDAWTPTLQQNLDNEWNKYKKDIYKLSEQERRVLLNNGRDFYYKNTYTADTPGVTYWSRSQDQKQGSVYDKATGYWYHRGPDGSLSPAYGNTWYGRQHASDQYVRLTDADVTNTSNKKFYPAKKQDGGNSFIGDLGTIGSAIMTNPVLFGNIDFLKLAGKSLWNNLVNDSDSPQTNQSTVDKEKLKTRQLNDYYDWLKYQENGVKKGWDSKLNVWMPYKSHEGGLPTIGYGHKLTPEDVKTKRFAKGITDDQAIKLMKDDFNSHYDQSVQGYNKRFKDRNLTFDTLPYNQQLLIEDYVYNLGPDFFQKDTEKYSKAFPKFLDAIVDYNQAKSDADRLKYRNIIAKQYARGTKKAPNRERNKGTVEFFLKDFGINLDMVDPSTYKERGGEFLPKAQGGGKPNRYFETKQEGDKYYVQQRGDFPLSNQQFKNWNSPSAAFSSPNQLNEWHSIGAHEYNKLNSQAVDGRIGYKTYAQGGSLPKAQTGIPNDKILQTPMKYDRPLKLADIKPVYHKNMVINNYSPRADYLIQGDKVYMTDKGKDNWLDISDNDIAKKNLYGFLDNTYQMMGYSNEEKDILGLLKSNQYNYQQRYNPTPKKQEPSLQYLWSSGSVASPKINIDPFNGYVKGNSSSKVVKQKPSLTENIQNELSTLVGGTEDYLATVVGDIKNTYNEAADVANYYKNLAINGLTRKYKMYSGDDPDAVKIDFSEKQTPKPLGTIEYYNKLNKNKVQLKEVEIPNVTNKTGQTLLAGNINLANMKFKVRNRGDYTPFQSDGAIITAFRPFLAPSEYKAASDNSTYFGVDANGNFVAGTFKDFKNRKDVLISQTFSNKVVSFDEIDGKSRTKPDLDHGNNNYQIPITNMLSDDEKTEKKGSINIMTRTNGDEDYFGSVEGGKFIMQNPDTKKTYFVMGSLKHIKNEFKKIKGNSKYVTVYATDNGTYSKGLSFKDKTFTSDRLKEYDALNSGGVAGNVLYIAGTGTTPSRHKVEYYQSPNIRTEKDESYKKGHALKNEMKKIVLHWTAFKPDAKGDWTQSDIDLHNQFMRPGENDAHLAVLANGTRRVYASPEQVTAHAGHSRYENRDNVNDFSYGIELQNPGNDSGGYAPPLTPNQLESTVEAISELLDTYNLKLKDIITHKEIRDGYMKYYEGKKDKDGKLIINDPNDKKTKVDAKADIDDQMYNTIINALKARGYK